MNRREAKALLPIIQAYAEGKHVQYLNGNNLWCDPDSDGKNERSITFGGKASYYRIKPEPEVIYVNRYASIDVSFDFENDAIMHHSSTSMSDPDQIREDMPIAKKFVEVIE